MISCPRDSSPLRTTTLWPASPCWATLSPSHPSRRTSTKTTSSNSTLNPTSTTSDRRASTPLKGTVNSDRSSKCIYVYLIHHIFGAGAGKNIQLYINLLDDGHTYGTKYVLTAVFSLVFPPPGGWRWSAAPRAPPAAHCRAPGKTFTDERASVGAPPAGRRSEHEAAQTPDKDSYYYTVESHRRRSIDSTLINTSERPIQTSSEVLLLRHLHPLITHFLHHWCLIRDA